jgi:hypothetical protein
VATNGRLIIEKAILLNPMGICLFSPEIICLSVEESALIIAKGAIFAKRYRPLGAFI